MYENPNLLNRINVIKSKRQNVPCLLSLGVSFFPRLDQRPGDSVIHHSDWLQSVSFCPGHHCCALHHKEVICSSQIYLQSILSPIFADGTILLSLLPFTCSLPPPLFDFCLLPDLLSLFFLPSIGLQCNMLSLCYVHIHSLL